MEIKPYLILKKLQAEIALKYLETVLTKRESGWKKGEHIPWNKRLTLIPDDVVDFREQCYKKLKSEKKRFSGKNRIEVLL